LQKSFAFAYALTGRTPAKVGGREGGKGGGSNPFAAFLEGLIGGGEGGGREGGRGRGVKYPEDDMAVLRFVNGFILKAGIANK